MSYLLTYYSFLILRSLFLDLFSFLRVHPLYSSILEIQVIINPLFFQTCKSLLFLFFKKIVLVHSSWECFPHTLASSFCFGLGKVYCLPHWCTSLIPVSTFSNFIIIWYIGKLLFYPSWDILYFPNLRKIYLLILESSQISLSLHYCLTSALHQSPNFSCSNAN